MGTKKTKITTAANGIQCRLKNKRITVVETEENKFVLQFDFACDDSDKPAVSHTVSKGKIRHSLIALSKEALDAIAFGYVQYQRTKNLKPDSDGN